MSNFSKGFSIHDLIFLHVILLIYAGSSICSKLASAQEFMSLPFVLLYGGVVIALMIYAILWQQVLKKMPLTVAYANKSVVMIWGMLAGALIWNETINWIMIAGAIIIMCGVCLVVNDN